MLQLRTALLPSKSAKNKLKFIPKKKINFRLRHNLYFDLNIKPKPVRDPTIKKQHMIVDIDSFGIDVYKDNEFDWYFFENTPIKLRWTGEGEKFDARCNGVIFTLIMKGGKNNDTSYICSSKKSRC